jgi:hypothetical protein
LSYPPDQAPPDAISPASYKAWLSAIGSAPPCPYADELFQWHSGQLSAPLPAQVGQDADHLFVDVTAAIAETDVAENAGDVDAATTVGFDAYSLVEVPIETALEAALFFFGKPIGQTEGETYPFDLIFAQSHWKIRAKWGVGSYSSQLSDTGGGIVKALHDDYTVLVRRSTTNTYSIVCIFYGETAGEQTATTSHINAIVMSSQTGNKTALRHRLRRTGQNYSMLGGRASAFNVSAIRRAQKAFDAALLELRATGTIRQNKPHGS